MAMQLRTKYTYSSCIYSASFFELQFDTSRVKSVSYFSVHYSDLVRYVLLHCF